MVQFRSCIYLATADLLHFHISLWFCHPLGKNTLKRGLTISSAGLLITIVTLLTMPENQVIFGVLTLIGACMLLLIPLNILFRCFLSEYGFIVSLFLFFITKSIGKNWIGIGPIHIFTIPTTWQHNLFSTFLGFPMDGFYSTDYFPMLPWIFLFIAGYFLCQSFQKRSLMHHLIPSKVKPIEWLGKHSLGIYLLHQPVLFGLLTLVI